MSATNENTGRVPADAPGMSRRAVLRTAAWTAPAIVFTVAAPAAAASGIGTIALTDTPYSIRKGAAMTVQGTVHPAGEYTFSVAEVVADGTARLATVNSVTTTKDGVFSFAVQSTESAAMELQLELGGSEVFPLTVPIRNDELLQIEITSATARLNGENKHYIETSDDFTVTVARDGVVQASREVVVTIDDPAARFPDGTQTFIGHTDAAGQVAMPVLPALSADRRSSTNKLTATVAGNVSEFVFVIASTEQRIVWTTTEAFDTAVRWSTGDAPYLILRMPEPATNSASDRWRLTSTTVPPAGTWLRRNDIQIMRWGSDVLDVPIPAGFEWSFDVINITGRSPNATIWHRLGFDGADYTVLETFSTQLK
jgi:hypothetical protein